ncbi:MAG: carboxypeptidase-like regulatory domain-containing protein, partial [Pirellulaceae bacterium]
MKAFSVIVFLHILFIDFNIYAASIFGYIREMATGEPLAYANVFIQESGFGDAANEDGYYAILNLPEGDYDISISIIGYEMITQPITILTDEEKRIDFRLKQQA